MDFFKMAILFYMPLYMNLKEYVAFTIFHHLVGWNFIWKYKNPYFKVRINCLKYRHVVCLTGSHGVARSAIKSVYLEVP